MSISSVKEKSFEIKEAEERVPSISDYTPVDPIIINSLSDWSLYLFITGNGSDLNPYIIENVEIQGTGVKTREMDIHTYLNRSDVGIYINAGGTFIIRNCKISYISIGIYLDVGVSIGVFQHIENVEINNCGLGIYSYWPHINVNISRCNISNCNWVTIKTPLWFDIQYGGYGIWLGGGSLGSVIEYCHIQDCSIGMLISIGVNITNNQLVNCGLGINTNNVPTYIYNNTVNGKQIGFFFGMDNLILSKEEASNFGQLIFIYCDNLQLSDIHIEDSCSIGLTLIACSSVRLRNIICENQKIGLYIDFSSITADHLYAKNCDAGFFFRGIRDSYITQLMTDNTEVPVYSYGSFRNSTIEIEKSTKFYVIDSFDYDRLQLVSLVSSFNVSPSFISDLDFEGFLIQLNDTQTYHVTDSDPEIDRIDFTIVSTQRGTHHLLIPGIPFIYIYAAFIIGIIYLIISFCRKKNIKVYRFHSF